MAYMIGRRHDATDSGRDELKSGTCDEHRVRQPVNPMFGSNSWMIGRPKYVNHTGWLTSV